MFVKFEGCRECLLVTLNFSVLVKSKLFISGVVSRKKRQGLSPPSESAPVVESVSRRSLRLGVMAGVGVPVGVEAFNPWSPGPPGFDGPSQEEGLAVVVCSALLAGRILAPYSLAAIKIIST